MHLFVCFFVDFFGAAGMLAPIGLVFFRQINDPPKGVKKADFVSINSNRGGNNG